MLKVMLGLRPQLKAVVDEVRLAFHFIGLQIWGESPARRKPPAESFPFMDKMRWLPVCPQNASRCLVG